MRILLGIMVISSLFISCGILFPHKANISIQADSTAQVSEFSEVYAQASDTGSGYKKTEGFSLLPGGEKSVEIEFFGSETELEIHVTYPINTTQSHSGMCKVGKIASNQEYRYTITYNGSFSCQ